MPSLQVKHWPLRCISAAAHAGAIAANECGACGSCRVKGLPLNKIAESLSHRSANPGALRQTACNDSLSMVFTSGNAQAEKCVTISLLLAYVTCNVKRQKMVQSPSLTQTSAVCRLGALRAQMRHRTWRKAWGYAREGQSKRMWPPWRCPAPADGEP